MMNKYGFVIFCIIFSSELSVGAVSKSLNLSFKPDANWTQMTPPKNSQIELIYKSQIPSKTPTLLTVRKDSLNKSQKTLKRYLSLWLKRYPKFGFDVLKAKKIYPNREDAFYVDVINQKKSTQFRQMIYSHNKDIFIVTCSGQVSTFQKEMAECNQLISTMKWVH